MATEIQDAFEKSIVELGFESLLDESSTSLEEVEEQEQSEEPEAEGDEDEGVEDDPSFGDEDKQDDDDDEDADDSTVIEIAQDAKLKLPDGTVVDAEQAVLLQADYTRKTQELAEQRRQLEQQRQQTEAQYQQAYSQMRDWYEARAARPSDWLTEIASQTQDPTATVAQAIYTMAQNGMLDPKFVETFGIESGPVAEVAKGSQVESELEELKRWRYEQEMNVQRQAQVRERAAVYEQEWESIKTSRKVTYPDRATELEAKRELLQFALENNLTRSLTDAYDLMTVRKPKSVSAKPQPDAEVVAKKRASRAVSSKSASSSKPVKKVMTDKDAILAALEEQGI